MPPTPAPAKGGNILTRKFGPLPGWAWAAIGVAGFFIYKQRKASEAATAAASTASGTSVAPITSTAASSPIAQAPSGYGYQGPGVGGGGSGSVPTGATASTSTGATGVSGVGSGGQPGTFYPTGANYAQLNASGLADQTYYQAPGQPGVYLPVTYAVASQGLAGGQPLAIGPTFTPS